MPGLDFANHDDGVRTQFAAGLRGGLALLCDRDYQRGGEITTTYGPKSNAQMLMSFGFARQAVEHPFNSADILLSLRSDDDMRSAKIAALHKAGLAPSMRFRVPSSSPLIRKGLALRAPPYAQHLQPPASLAEATVSRFPLAGEEEVVASWAQVLPFVRLSVFSRADARRLGVGEGAEKGEGWQGGAAAACDQKVAGAEAPAGDLWERMWQPLPDGLEEKALAALCEHLERLRTDIASLDGACEEGDAEGKCSGPAPDTAHGRGPCPGRRAEAAARARRAEAYALEQALRILSAY